LAAVHIRASLVRWGGDTQAPQLIAELVRAYTATELTPEGFKNVERKWLADVAQKYAALRPLIDDISHAFSDDVEAGFSSVDRKDRFAAWSGGPPTASFSALLKSIGDRYVTLEKGRDALAHYAAAWRLDQANLDAAVAFAGLLQEQYGDSARGKHLVEEFIGMMIDWTSAGNLLNKPLAE